MIEKKKVLRKYDLLRGTLFSFLYCFYKINFHETQKNTKNLYSRIKISYSTESQK